LLTVLLVCGLALLASKLLIIIVIRNIPQLVVV